MFEYQIDNKNKFMGSIGYVNAEFTSGTLTPGHWFLDDSMFLQ